MVWLVLLLYWKVSVLVAPKSLVSCPKWVCAWWADAADNAYSVTFSDGNVLAVYRFPLRVQPDPLSDCGGSLALCLSFTLTHIYKTKYAAVMTCHCMRRSHFKALRFYSKLHCWTTEWRSLQSTSIILKECCHDLSSESEGTTFININGVCVCLHVCARQEKEKEKKKKADVHIYLSGGVVQHRPGRERQSKKQP